MQRIAFKMKLKKGFSEEYCKRHDSIWPELQTLLENTGISDYGIYLDEDGVTLFALMKVADPEAQQRLPEQEIMQRWWKYMGDIMETNPDDSPIIFPLKEVFYMA